jgi:hypothetical protein
MTRTTSAFHSIRHFKCPYCGKGEFFQAHPYNLRRAGDIHDRCPECDGRYSIEPGFYYGAMYVSYGLGVAIAATVWVAFLVLAPKAEPHWIVGTVGAVLLLAGPYLYALSRIIWAHMFLDFENPTGRKGAGKETV